jgi:protein O-mannosyl-transferase
MRTDGKIRQVLPAGASVVPLPWARSQPHNRWLSLVICLFLALAVWAVFGQTLYYEFVNYDDRLNLYENPAVARGLSLQGIVWAFTHVGDREWYPVTWISRMADLQLYGMNAGGHHSTNVLLHTASTILLFLVLRRMTGRIWPSAFVAAVFAIHPLRVESVAWVTERKDVLSGFFFMLTLWAYVRYVEKSMVGDQQSVISNEGTTDHARRITLHGSLFYALSLLFFALGLLAKTMLVTLPFVLLLLDYWPLRRLQLNTPRSTRNISPTALLLEKLPFFALAAAGCVATLLSQPGAQELSHGLTLPWRIGNALMAYADYLGHMVYPVGLAVGYAPPPPHLPAWRVGLSLMILAVIWAGVLAGCKKQPYLLVGWLWYFGMLVPVIGIMQAGINARADRFTYLPQIGLYLGVAWGAANLCRGWRHGRALLASAAAAIVAALLAGAYVQTKHWKDSISLWTRAVACTPTNQIAHNNLGILLAGQGRLDEAVQHFQRAVQLKPDYAKAYYNLGSALGRQGKLLEATQQFERAVQLSPGYLQARMNLASALAAQGNLNEAVQHFQQALSLAQAQNNPALAEAISNQLKQFQSVSPQRRMP